MDNKQNSKLRNFIKNKTKIWLVPVALIDKNTPQTLETMYREVLNFDYEGIMIYLSNGFYEHKRTWNLIKFKESETEWFEIVGTEPQIDGNMSILKYKYGNKICTADGLFSQNFKHYLNLNPDSMNGKWALIRFQKHTVASSTGTALRHAKVLSLHTEADGEEIDIEKLAIS